MHNISRVGDVFIYNPLTLHILLPMTHTHNNWYPTPVDFMKKANTLWNAIKNADKVSKLPHDLISEANPTHH